MNHYIVTISLPWNPDEEFMALIPQQKAQVDGLMNVGVITSYSLSIDRTQLWVTLTAESEGKAHKIIDKFPLRKYMDVRVTELMFHNTLAFSAPQMFLN
jgi:muconolactone delta-isomerase